EVRGAVRAASDDALQLETTQLDLADAIARVGRDFHTMRFRPNRLRCEPNTPPREVHGKSGREPTVAVTRSAPGSGGASALALDASGADSPRTSVLHTQVKRSPILATLAEATEAAMAHRSRILWSLTLLLSSCNDERVG